MRDYDPRYPDEYNPRPSRPSSGYGRSGASPEDYTEPRDYSARRPAVGRSSGAYDDYPSSGSRTGGSYEEGGYAGGRTGNPYGDDYGSARASRAGGYGDEYGGYVGGRSAGSRGGENDIPPRGAYGGPAGSNPYGSVFDEGYPGAGISRTGSYDSTYNTASRGAYGESSRSGSYDTGYGGDRGTYATGSYDTDYGSGRGASRTGSYSTDYGNTRGTTRASSYDSNYGSARGSYSTGSTGYGSSREPYGASHDDADFGSGRGASRTGSYGSAYGGASRGSYGGSAFENTYQNPYGAGRTSRPSTSSLYDDDDDDDDDRSDLTSRKAAVKKKNKMLNIWITCLSVLLVVSILSGLLLPNLLRAETPAPPSSSSVPEETYDKDANLLPFAELGETVLGETEDAGAEYVEETLFIGDSNTLRMMYYTSVPEITLDNCIGVESMGIQSVPSFPCVQFEGYSSLSTIPEAVAIMQPLRAILTFGTNNASSAAEVDSFIASYRAAVESIQAAYSYTDIIIGAIPPVAQVNSSNAVAMTTIDVFNVALAKLAQEMELKFLNWSEVLKDPATGYCAGGYVIEDGIHLSEEGVIAMTNYMRTHSYITEDTRPKPLKAIPKHIDATSSEGTSSAVSSIASTGTSSPASSTPAGVKVVYGTLEHVIQSTTAGGKIQVAGQTTNSYTTYVQPNGVCPTAVAVPAEGYRFLYWAVSVGSIPDRESATLANFVVWPTLAQGDTLTITAIFEGVTPAPSTITVTLASGGNGAAPSPTSVQVAPGSSITVTAGAPDSGYQFDSWSASSGSFGSSTAPSTSFTVPANQTSNITITANYVPATPVTSS